MTAEDDLLERHCPTCFIHYAAPKALFDRKNETGEAWYCPNGHHIIYKVSKLQQAKDEAAALRRERDRLKQNEAYYIEQQEHDRRAKRDLTKQGAALKGQLTKIRKRVGNGVCPCCNRTFSDLQRHMSNKHADYRAEVA